MDEYHLKTGKLGEKIVRGYKKIEDKFTDAFLEEDGSLKTGGMAEKATGAYQKIEDAVVGGYKKIENTFVDTFLEKDDQAHWDEVSSAGEVDSKSGKSPEDAEQQADGRQKQVFANAACFFICTFFYAVKRIIYACTPVSCHEGTMLGHQMYHKWTD